MTHVSPCAMLSLKIKVGSKMQIYKQTDSKSVCVCVGGALARLSTVAGEL